MMCLPYINNFNQLPKLIKIINTHIFNITLISILLFTFKMIDVRIFT